LEAKLKASEVLPETKLFISIGPQEVISEIEPSTAPVSPMFGELQDSRSAAMKMTEFMFDGKRLGPAPSRSPVHIREELQARDREFIFLRDAAVPWQHRLRAEGSIRISRSYTN